MGTTPGRLGEWFDVGVQNGATHMVIVCDTFDHEDFPVYVQLDQDARTVAKAHDDAGRMMKVMEVYNLRMDREAQLVAGTRVFNY
jgi:hypothetical protein